MEHNSGPIEINLDGITHDINIIEVIRRGVRYNIFKARLGTKYVILKSPTTHDAMSIEILRREYELSQHISHANIVNTLRFDEHTPVGPAIIIEWIEGKTLDTYIESNPTATERAEVLDGILNGLEYLHNLGIIHNDLKADNILVNKHGSARIIDFGLSISDDSAYKGYIGGTQGYSAPEVMQGKSPNGPCSDIYAVGKLISIIYNGKRYRSITKRCCQQNPTARYKTISEIRKAIRNQRHIPYYIFAAILLCGILAMVITPHIRETHRQAIHAQQKIAATNALEESYLRVQNTMKQQEYKEFAGLARSQYLQDYVKYRATLPESQQLACDEVYAKHIAELDKIINSLPSISSLPLEQQAPLIELFNQGCLPR